MDIAKPIEATVVISGTLVFKNDAGEVVKTADFSMPPATPTPPETTEN